MVRYDTAVHQHRIRSSSLDEATASGLLLDARAAIASGARALVIDFTGVERFDSAGIAALLMLRRQLPGDVRVVLASMSVPAQRIAWITHLQDIFDIYTDVRIALEDLSI